MVLPPEKPIEPSTYINARILYPPSPKYGAAPIAAQNTTPTTVYQNNILFFTGILSAITPNAGAVTATIAIAIP
ncbi:MAG: Uncharacterised protein [Methanobacteriota archaeon]|nr:MAG: Uncharacterised protein [Euryarchaeota archaeon]